MVGIGAMRGGRVPGGGVTDPDGGSRGVGATEGAGVVGRGAGLGLSMARDVLKKHHGTLEVKSVIGEGTTFALRLPLTQPT